MHLNRILPWLNRRLVLLLVPLLALVGLAVSGCSLTQVSAESRLFAAITLEFIDDYPLPQTLLQDIPVGGLSGMTYNAQTGEFYAVSDDRSNFGPARFYTLVPRIEPNAKTGNLEIKTVEIKSATVLKQETGEPYPANTIDAEGIALSPRGTLILSSEGVVKQGVPPAIQEHTLTTGTLQRVLPMPAAYLPQTQSDGTVQGIQDNKGFESLTIGVDGTPNLFRVFAAIENPLIQDQDSPEAQTSETRAKLRLLHYALTNGRTDLVGEYVYALEPKPAGTLEHGLSEILAIDPAGHFLALERTFGLTGFQVKLFQFTMAGAKDIQGMASLRALRPDTPLIRKQLVLDLADLGLTLDNLEAMSLGPKLPDGSQSLLMVSDDNFSKDQVTQFLLFRLKYD
jgi:hypothetical protein